MEGKANEMARKAQYQIGLLALTIDTHLSRSLSSSWWRQWKEKGGTFYLAEEDLKEKRKELNNLMDDLRRLQEKMMAA